MKETKSPSRQGPRAAIAKAIAKNRAKVVVNYCSDKIGAEAIVDYIIKNEGTAIPIRADVTKAIEVNRLFEETDTVYGKRHFDQQCGSVQI